MSDFYELWDERQECGCPVGSGHSCPIPFGHDDANDRRNCPASGVEFEAAPEGVGSTRRDLTTQPSEGLVDFDQSTHPPAFRNRPKGWRR